MNFYVYYRVAADTTEARAIVVALMADIKVRTGISGRLLARCDDPSTWMEIYETVADTAAFARALDASVLRSGAADVAVNGMRTVERFCALDPGPGEGHPRNG